MRAKEGADLPCDEWEGGREGRREEGLNKSMKIQLGRLTCILTYARIFSLSLLLLPAPHHALPPSHPPPPPPPPPSLPPSPTYLE